MLFPRSPIADPTTKRAKCTFPGCTKLFNRKEHLTRHLKSHDPQRQYECPICSRRYARSDVLKRHVEHHSRDTQPTRTLVACVYCHERKLKCDDGSPCRSCARNSIFCSRVRPGRGSQTSTSLDTSDADADIEAEAEADINEINNENEAPNGDHINGAAMGANDRMLVSETREIIPTNPHPSSWFQASKGAWSLTIPPTEPNAAFPDVAFSNEVNTGSIAQWTEGPSQQGHIGAAFSVAEPENTSFLLPATKDIQVEQLHATYQNGTDHDKRIAQSLEPQSPVSIEASSVDNVPDLHSFISKDPLVIQSLIDVYFVKVHPHWPILHVPTFDVTKTSQVLLGSILMLATWLEDDPNHVDLVPLVYDAVTSTLLTSNPLFASNIQPSSLHALQALLLCVVYMTCCSSTDGMLARAVHFNSILISSCRHLRIFSGQYDYHDSDDSPFVSWLAQEQLHRLAFSVLRVDTYLSILVDHPPTVRYQEMCIPLPKSSHLWTATSEDERRNLQWNEPVGRERALFNLIMRYALDLNRQHRLLSHINETDYHLILCAHQIGTWEVARDTHGCELDELATNPAPKNSFELWRTHLDRWRACAESDTHLRQAYFSTPKSTTTSSKVDPIFSPLSLIFWHLSALTLYTPFKVLQNQGCCFTCRPSGTTTTTRKREARLRAWLVSAEARMAVWNAAQIARIVTRESSYIPAAPTPTPNLLLNPLAMHSVLKAAIVICCYSYHTRACPVCTGGPPIDLVDLFGAKDDDERLVKWKKSGEGLGDWPPGGFPICNCKVVGLARWFRGLLTMDKERDEEFMRFLRELGTG